MSNRGRILRDTNSGNGLIVADGKQYELVLEKNWDSDTVPKIGMVVEVELNEQNQLSAAWPVDEAELAKEQASLILNETKKRVTSGYNHLATAVGKPVLLATVALILGWFIFKLFSISIKGGFMPTSGIELTFWQSLSIINNLDNIQSLIGGGSKGIYGFLCIVAIAGPFLFIFWKHPLAHLGNCLALLLMIIVAGSAYMTYADQIAASQEALSKIGGGFGASMAKKMTEGLLENLMKSVDIGLGAHLSVIASLYLAYVGITKYLIASASSYIPESTNTSSTRRSSARKSTQTAFAAKTDVPVHNQFSTTPLNAASTTRKNCSGCNAVTESEAVFCGECGIKII